MIFEAIMACVVLVMAVAVTYHQRKLRKEIDGLKELYHKAPAQPQSRTGVHYLSDEHEDRVRQRMEEDIDERLSMRRPRILP